MSASRETWAAAALQVLSQHGVTAVAVEPVAKRLGVTKGSFYWHFENRAALLRAALELWERRWTTEIIEELSEVADPVERLRQLFHRVSGGTRGSPSHAALASTDDPIVKETLQRVATARLAFLTQCYEDIGSKKKVARRRALLAYATYLGTLQIVRDSPGEFATKAAQDAYTEHVIETLVDRADR